MNKTKLSFILALAMTFAGCSAPSEKNNAAETQSVTETQAITEAVTSAENETAAETEAPTEQEHIMDKYNDMIVEIPPMEMQGIREGLTYPEFQKYFYYSNTAERDTPVNVLLPADYSEDKEYPVLYILHGYFDNEDWMTRGAVHISSMLTNLIADGEAKEMIIVCPYIYCSKDMEKCTGMDYQNSLNYDNFINDMMTDLMPYIEENFSVAKGRENTAITGFSMGGRESLFIAVSHPEKFGYVGAVCAAPGLTKGMGDPWQLEESELRFDDPMPRVILLSAAVNDNVVGQSPYNYDRILTENGTDHLWHTMEGTYHDASSVAPHLYNYFRMIFQD